ncbi:hypothetical protein I79_009752 [Cricetulus griseus]|uniref:Uncharacterized protein n=1 Tax=Cricetulus griseus TaxID=10029 RepID=G3HGL4_CRIGR|nr:hypothetical protein I79_009752 [Cricetulus griseus]
MKAKISFCVKETHQNIKSTHNTQTEYMVTHCYSDFHGNTWVTLAPRELVKVAGVTIHISPHLCKVTI